MNLSVPPGHKEVSPGSGVDQVAEVRREPPTSQHMHAASWGLQQILGSAYSPCLYDGLQDWDRLVLQAQHNPPTAVQRQPKHVLCLPEPCPSPAPGGPLGLGSPLPFWVPGSPRGCISCSSPPLGNAVLGPLGCGCWDASMSWSGKAQDRGHRAQGCVQATRSAGVQKALRGLDVRLHGSRMAKTQRENRPGAQEVITDTLLFNPKWDDLEQRFAAPGESAGGEGEGLVQELAAASPSLRPRQPGFEQLLHQFFGDAAFEERGTQSRSPSMADVG